MQVRLETLFRLTLSEREAAEVRAVLVAGIDASGVKDASSAAVRVAAALTEGLGVEVPAPTRRRRSPAETPAEV